MTPHRRRKSPARRPGNLGGPIAIPPTLSRCARKPGADLARLSGRCPTPPAQRASSFMREDDDGLANDHRHVAQCLCRSMNAAFSLRERETGVALIKNGEKGDVS